MKAQSHGQAVRLRPIALPTEHGGWSMLGAPVLLGLWVAPSPAGAWLSLAALGAFLTRQPLKLVLADWQRGRRYPRTAWAWRFALFYSGLALLAFVAAVSTTTHPFWPPLLLAAPLALVQFSYDLRRQSRAFIAELCGAAALSALAALLALAGGQAFGSAMLLWLLLALQALPAIIYVAARLRLARGEAVSRLPAYLAHFGAFLIVAVLALAGLVAWLTVAAFVVLAARVLIGLLPHSLHTPIPLVGVQELAFSLMTVAAIAAGN